jgi:choline kinase
MITESDLIFDELYDEFKRTIEADSENVNLLTYADEHDIDDDTMMLIWETYIIEVGKRNGVQK